MEEERLRRLVGALRAPSAPNGPAEATRDDLVGALAEVLASALDRVSGFARQVADEAHLQAAPQGSRHDLPVLRRPRFFTGQVLSAADLEAEQDYFRERQRLQNRLALGTGVAFGLEVACSDGPAGARVVVSPGLGVDPSGEIVALHEEARLPVGLDLPAFVCVRYFERPCDPVPAAIEAEPLEPTRIEEGARATVETELPADALAVARLVSRDGRAIVDPTFRARRVGRMRGG